MSLRVVPATAELVMKIRPQHLQAEEKFSAAEIALLLEQGPGKVLLDGERPIAAGGTIPLAPARRFAWMVMASEAGQHLARIVRTLRAELDLFPDARIEMTILAGWAGADRWARLLGFSYRETLRNIDHLGRDHDLYVRGG